jgi:hypothetical protein
MRGLGSLLRQICGDGQLLNTPKPRANFGIAKALPQRSTLKRIPIPSAQFPILEKTE